MPIFARYLTISDATAISFWIFSPILNMTTLSLFYYEPAAFISCLGLVAGLG
jgi:hypothetical protein